MTVAFSLEQVFQYSSDTEFEIPENFEKTPMFVTKKKKKNKYCVIFEKLTAGILFLRIGKIYCCSIYS